MKIDFFRIETTNIFHGLTEYQKTMEAQLTIIQEQEQSSIERFRDLDLPNTLPYESMMEEYDWVYEYFFPRSLRQSFDKLRMTAQYNAPPLSLLREKGVAPQKIVYDWAQEIEP